MSVIILTTGVPGCGKTYVRAARFLVDDFLVNGSGIHISNFPLNVDVIAEDVSKKINRSRGFFGIFRKKVTPEDIKKRLEIIPDDVLQSWRVGLSGPWDYFSGRDLKYAHIALDEIHNFINSRCSESVLKQWDDFLGEVRHRGCTFEGLTQDIGQVDSVLTGRASIRLELIPAEDLRDPFFKIRMLDWYELKAGFLGSFHKTVFMLEKRKSDSRWKTNHTSRFLITPEYFKYYNSFNASLQEKEQGVSDDDRVPQYEFQKRGKVSLFLWFLRRNWFTLFWRLLVAFFVIWLCFLGGLNFFIQKWISVSQSMYRSNAGNDKKRSLSDSSRTPEKKRSLSDSSRTPDKKTSIVEKQISLDDRKYLDEKKKEFENDFRPGLFFDGSCWLRNGIRVYPGYVFTNRDRDKDFFGKTVLVVSEHDRMYMLNDQRCIYMY